MDTYLWKYTFCTDIEATAVYYSDVDTGQEGEWTLVRMFPVWKLGCGQKVIFKTEQELRSYVDKNWIEYQAKNRQEDFNRLFKYKGLFTSIKLFIKYYINMEE